jgi:hypothetical protein
MVQNGWNRASEYKTIEIPNHFITKKSFILAGNSKTGTVVKLLTKLDCFIRIPSLIFSGIGMMHVLGCAVFRFPQHYHCCNMKWGKRCQTIISNMLLLKKETRS